MEIFSRIIRFPAAERHRFKCSKRVTADEVEEEIDEMMGVS
jgi:hypothetical protein